MTQVRYQYSKESDAASRPQDEKRKDDTDDSVTEPFVGPPKSEGEKAIKEEGREVKPSGKDIYTGHNDLSPQPVRHHVTELEPYPPPPITEFPDDFSQEEYASLFPPVGRPVIPVPICEACGAQGVRKVCTFWNERLGQTYWACPEEVDPHSGLNKIIFFEDEYVGDEFYDELGNYIYSYCGQDDVPCS